MTGNPDRLEDQKMDRVHWAGLSDTGRKRAHNEDCFALLHLDEGHMLAVISDGVGGQAAGEVASRVICEGAADLIKAGRLSMVSPDPAFWASMLSMALHHLHRKVHEAAHDESGGQPGMAATAILLLAGSGGYAFAHIGDSRVYKLSNGALDQLSTDQTVAQALVDAGRLAPKDIKGHPDRNVIAQAMGIERADLPLAPETGYGGWQPGDMLLACSDGLSDMLSAATIQRILDTATEAISARDSLLHQALQAGGKDNITLVLAANDG